MKLLQAKLLKQQRRQNFYHHQVHESCYEIYEALTGHGFLLSFNTLDRLLKIERFPLFPTYFVSKRRMFEQRSTKILCENCRGGS